MFEVGFTEIVLILGLALLVLGPEKLPGLAQKVGRWTGRARAMARQLRTQLEQEVTLDELSRSRPMSTATPQPEPATPDLNAASPAASTAYSSSQTEAFSGATHAEPENHIHPAAAHPDPVHSAAPTEAPAVTKPEQ
ncbi:MAG: Sec-independent protein translocase protein TatB [Povalibacter sp.]